FPPPFLFSTTRLGKGPSHLDTRRGMQTTGTATNSERSSATDVTHLSILRGAPQATLRPPAACRSTSKPDGANSPSYLVRFKVGRFSPIYLNASARVHHRPPRAFAAPHAAARTPRPGWRIRTPIDRIVSEVQ